MLLNAFNAFKLATDLTDKGLQRGYDDKFLPI